MSTENDNLSMGTKPYQQESLYQSHQMWNFVEFSHHGRHQCAAALSFGNN
ncbi:MAG: hypothetical protein WCK86_23970 [Planctomycetia bacterium]